MNGVVIDLGNSIKVSEIQKQCNVWERWKQGIWCIEKKNEHQIREDFHQEKSSS